jgi:glutamate dehydrogenase
VRVSSAALRVRVVAEGGNLGVTQRGRVAYALAGGHVNVDAVDNSAGVDLSDHEVNLKICLAPQMASGRLTLAARNALLADVQDEVAASVLAHNVAQSRLLTFDQRRSQVRLDDFRLHMGEIERGLGVPRARLGLPDWEALRARQATAPGLTRPELAVLAAWTKIELGAALRASPLPDDPGLESYLHGYFPARFRGEHAEAVGRHQLRREIVVVELVNTLVDALGTTFAHRVARTTGRTIAEVCRASEIAWRLVEGGRAAAAIRAACTTLADEIAAVFLLEDVCLRTSRWVLASAAAAGGVGDVAAGLCAAVAPARARLDEWLAGAEAEGLHRRRAALELGGLPADVAHDLAVGEWLPSLLDVVTVAQETGVELDAVGRRYYGLGREIDFAWLDAELGAARDLDPLAPRALEGIADDLRAARRRFARTDAPPSDGGLRAVRQLIDDVKANGRPTLAALVVVARAIRRLSGGVE